MSHQHPVYDTDKSFTVDPISRTIVKDAENNKTMVVQHDHHSEEFTFRVPRHVEGHDMMECNRVEVHYLNIESTKRNQYIGVYTAENLQVDPEDESYVKFTWLISHNATQLAGSLNFVIRFACITQGSIDYSWNTVPYTDVIVSSSIYNAEVIEDYTDILEQWEKRLANAMLVSLEQTVTASENGGVNIITATMGDGSEVNFEIRNGTLPVKGEDFWTEEDQEEIVDDVLNVLNYNTSIVSLFVDNDGVVNAQYTSPDEVTAMFAATHDETDHYVELEDGTVIGMDNIVESEDELDINTYNFDIDWGDSSDGEESNS